MASIDELARKAAEKVKESGGKVDVKVADTESLKTSSSSGFSA